ncbi:hypothetical protein [Vibrio phage vB_VmeM-Yong XC32]|nr:hypothetical protein [Vibrio phage vB_VmeM-Yong XC31]QAX96424.1 hypothetical protein [Vibrio phage vB_VmeM-Yong XC32]QAX96741.1 hypothetical protein [Vibrio phage vB_VmeM-Yong MS31]QAX97060.1 hypothetical protein [Vibrio phage vB_VmeM-Yong MS32]
MSQVLLGADHSLNRGANTGVADPRVGAQNGLVPDFANWANSGKMVKQRLIPVLIQEPSGMQLMDDGPSRIEFLKAMVELLPKSITGLNRSKEGAFLETVATNSGEVMETVTRVSRQRSTPTYVWDELDGKPITRSIEDWMDELMQDSITGHPGIISKPAYEEAGSPAISPDFQSMVVLFIEPNRQMNGVTSAYLCANMMPKSFTDESSRVVGEDLEGMEQTVEFTAFTMTGTAVNAMALEYLNSVQKTGLAPRGLAPFQAGRSVNVASDAAPLGNVEAVNAVAATL